STFIPQAPIGALSLRASMLRPISHRTTLDHLLSPRAYKPLRKPTLQQPPSRKHPSQTPHAPLACRSADPRSTVLGRKPGQRKAANSAAQSRELSTTKNGRTLDA